MKNFKYVLKVVIDFTMNFKNILIIKNNYHKRIHNLSSKYLSKLNKMENHEDYKDLTSKF